MQLYAFLANCRDAGIPLDICVFGKYSERCGMLPAVRQVRNGFLEVATVVVFTVNFCCLLS